MADQGIILQRPPSAGPMPALGDDVPRTAFDRILVAAKNLVGGATGLVDPFSGPDAPRAAAVGQALSVLLPVLAMAKAAKAARGVKATEQAVEGITAYHGSPYDFDKFDISKIGTGEGAQAYGHGLYFAEDPRVSATYSGKVTTMKGGPAPQVDGRPINWDNPIETAAFEAARHQGDRMAAAEFFERTFKESEVPKILRSGIPLPPVKLAGNQYQVKINASPDQFLDWDKPLSQQSRQVQESLGVHANPRDFAAESRAIPGSPEYAQLERKMDTRIGSPAVPDVTGGEYYRSDVLRQSASDEAALSDALKAKGIAGIKYLDAGSRATGEGSRNYVVFDAALIEILKKFGIAAPALGMLEAYAKSHGGAVPAPFVESVIRKQAP